MWWPRVRVGVDAEDSRGSTSLPSEGAIKRSSIVDHPIHLLYLTLALLHPDVLTSGLESPVQRRPPALGPSFITVASFLPRPENRKTPSLEPFGRPASKLPWTACVRPGAERGLPRTLGAPRTIHRPSARPPSSSSSSSSPCGSSPTPVLVPSSECSNRRWGPTARLARSGRLAGAQVVLDVVRSRQLTVNGTDLTGSRQRTAHRRLARVSSHTLALGLALSSCRFTIILGRRLGGPGKCSLELWTERTPAGSRRRHGAFDSHAAPDTVTSFATRRRATTGPSPSRGGTHDLVPPPTSSSTDDRPLVKRRGRPFSRAKGYPFSERTLGVRIASLRGGDPRPCPRRRARRSYRGQEICPGLSVALIVQPSDAIHGRVVFTCHRRTSFLRPPTRSTGGPGLRFGRPLTA